MKSYSIIILLVLALCAFLVGCTSTAKPEPSTEVSAITEPTEVSSQPTIIETTSAETTPSVPVVPEYEIELVAKTLRGECYDEQHDDKREVVKVICNRVSMGGFGDSVEAVITAPKQFVGYRPGNIPTANDYEIAREILTEWYEGGCVPLGEYLFFSSGDGHKNAFRKTWK